MCRSLQCCSGVAAGDSPACLDRLLSISGTQQLSRKSLLGSHFTFLLLAKQSVLLQCAQSLSHHLRWRVEYSLQMIAQGCCQELSTPHLLGAAQVRSGGVHRECEDAEGDVDDDGVDVGGQEGGLEASQRSVDAHGDRNQECGLQAGREEHCSIARGEQQMRSPRGTQRQAGSVGCTADSRS